MPTPGELVATFRDNSLAAATLHREGRTAAGNRKADSSHAAYTQLAADEEGRAALRALLEDPERVVQIDVAGRLWPDPEAVAALERWAQADDVRGRQAAFVLKYARLADEDPGSDPAPPSATDAPLDAAAEQAEEDVVAFHGLVMNGGVDHAIGVSGASEVDRVLSALRSLGREELARLVETVRDDPETDDEVTARWPDDPAGPPT